MNASRVAVCFALCGVIVSSRCCGQIREEIKARQIEKGEDLLIELMARRAHVPDRWAALQEREVHNLTKLDELEAGLAFTREFSAYSKEKSATAQHYLHQSHYDRDQDRTSSIDMEIRVHKKPGLCLYRANAKPWQIVPNVPFTGYCTTDPFNWCIGTYGSSKSGKLDEKWIDVFTAKRVCVSGNDLKAGFQAVWGNPFPQKSPCSTATILFDKSTNLPISVQWNYYPKDWDPKEFAKTQSKTYEKATITWQEFKTEKEPKLYLPIKIEITHLGVLEDEHIEVLNRIRWLLDEKVPDAVFEDPSKTEIIEPEFPPYPTEKKRARR